MQQKKNVFKRCSRFYFEGKNQTDKSKNNIQPLYTETSEIPESIQRYFFKCCAKIHKKKILSQEIEYFFLGVLGKVEHFVQYFTFVPPSL